MTEEERARYYEEHKDDPEVWEDVMDAPTAPRRKGLSATITVRFSPEEAEAIRDFARRYYMSYSDVVRKAVRRLRRSDHHNRGRTHSGDRPVAADNGQEE